MKFSLNIRSFSGSIISAAFLFTSAAIAQAPTDNPTNLDAPLLSTNISAVKIDKNKTLAAIEKFAPETAKKAEDSPQTADSLITKAPQASSGPKWEFGTALYLWLPGLSGDVGANNRTLAIDLSPLDTLKHFKAGFMGTFEARRGKLVILNDLVWSKLTEENDTPGPFYNTSKVSVNMTLFHPQAGYRLAESKAGTFDILGGVRITSVKNILSTTTGVLPGFTAEARKTWAAPTIGGHGVINVSEKVYLSTIFDIGGGFGTNVTGQFYGGMGYRVKPKAALVFGYRYLKNDYSDDAGYLFDTNMHGLVFGMVFKF